MPAAKKKGIDTGARVREIARERVGAVPPAKVMIPKTARKKPKHKKSPLAEDTGE